jgi:uncharacterized protein
MLYIDTSALVPMCLSQEATENILQYIASQSGEVAVSDWGITEFYSALGSSVRARALTPRVADQAVNELFHQLRDGLMTYRVDHSDQEKAQSIMSHWRNSPKAGDAVHLAITSRLQAQLLTRDKAMARHAKNLQIETKLIK